MPCFSHFPYSFARRDTISPSEWKPARVMNCSIHRFTIYQAEGMEYASQGRSGRQESRQRGGREAYTTQGRRSHPAVLAWSCWSIVIMGWSPPMRERLRKSAIISDCNELSLPTPHIDLPLSCQCPCRSPPTEPGTQMFITPPPAPTLDDSNTIIRQQHEY